MANQDIPPQLLFPDTQYEIIRNGTVGIVFKLSNEYAAKILFKGDIFSDTENFIIRNDLEALTSLQKEVDINCQLYKNGVNVPKPIGVESLSMFTTSFPAYIMEFLPHPTGSDLYYPDRGIARSLALVEVSKAIELGINPGNDWDNPNNFMYDRIERKTYLIDFGRWEFESDYKKVENGECC